MSEDLTTKFLKLLETCEYLLRHNVHVYEQDKFLIRLIFLKHFIDNLNSDISSLNKKKIFSLPKLYSTWKKIQEDILKNTSAQLDKIFLKIEESNPYFKGVLTNMKFSNSFDDEVINKIIVILDKFNFVNFNVDYSVFSISREEIVPKEINILAAALINTKKFKTFYNSTCRQGDVLEEVLNNSENSIRVFADEINQILWSNCKLRMYFNNFFNSAINNIDILMSKEFDTLYDTAICFPPFGVKISNDLFNLQYNDPRFYPRFNSIHRTSDMLYVQHVISLLNQEGQAVFLLPHSFLFQSRSEILRFLVNEDLLEMIVNFPQGVLIGTNIKACLIIINKNKKQTRKYKVLTIVDEIFEDGFKRKILKKDIDKIVSLYKEWKEEKNFSFITSRDDIIKFDYNFNSLIGEYKSNQYSDHYHSEYTNFNKMKLGALIIEVKKVSRRSDFKFNNVFYIPSVGNGPAVSKRSDSKCSDQNLYMLELDDKIVKSEYLQSYFKTDIGIQSRRICLQGSTIPYLSIQGLKLINVFVPSIKIQEGIIKTVSKFKKINIAVKDIEKKIILNPTDKIQNQLIDNFLLSLGKLSKEDEILSLIRKGESKTLEFKESLSLNKHTKMKDIKLERAVINTIAAFLNSDGGQLLIGVHDTGRLVGLDDEINLFYKKYDVPKDRFLLHLKNLIKDNIGENFYPFIEQNIIEIKNKKLVTIICKQSDREVFVDNLFPVRTNPGTDLLEGPKAVEYIRNRFDTK